jgi:hypothetical protein
MLGNLSMDESLSSKIRRLRPPKPLRRAGESMGWTSEQEPDGQGGLVSSRTYFLVGSECRFTCSMCDLWKYTLGESHTPPGSIAVQIETLHEQVSKEIPESKHPEWIKLYNASNFFDPANVLPDEYDSIAKLCKGFRRVVVENHASMMASKKTQDSVLRFRDLIEGRLEVAMGLETIDPNAMKWLNKSMSLEQFQKAVEFLNGEEIFVRSFVLLQPLGTRVEESVEWALKSCRQAAAWGSQRVSLIPTRSGNGFVEDVASQIGWEPPTASQLETAFNALLVSPQEKGVHGARSSIYTVDLWDWKTLAGTCEVCSQWRHDRLERMNQLQRVLESHPPRACTC